MASFTPPPSTPLRDIGQKATWPLVFVILLAATVIYVITPVLAIDWAQRVPFPSVLLQPNLLVSDASGSDWGPTPQLDALDRVVGINTTPVTDQLLYDQALINAWANGDQSVSVSYDRSASITPRPCGQVVAPGLYRCETMRPLQKIEPAEFGSLFVLPYGLGLVYLLIGIWVFRQRGNQRTSQVLALFSGTASVIFATYFDGLTTNRLQWAAFLAMGASGGALLSLSLLFPQTARVIDLGDKRAHRRLVAIVVADERAAVGPLERQGVGIERPLHAEPGVVVVVFMNARAERVRLAVAHHRVGPIGAHQNVAIGKLRGLRRPVLKIEFDAGLRADALQLGEQRQPLDR